MVRVRVHSKMFRVTKKKYIISLNLLLKRPCENNAFELFPYFQISHFILKDCKFTLNHLL